MSKTYIGNFVSVIKSVIDLCFGSYSWRIHSLVCGINKCEIWPNISNSGAPVLNAACLKSETYVGSANNKPITSSNMM